jgi:hypothetical protein
VHEARKVAESQYDVSVHNFLDNEWGDGGYRDTQLHCFDLHIPFQEVLEEIERQKELFEQER